ncbi:MAG TPA: FGGY family carbohydrate kinase [Chloroflexota bacterium]|nr:FGGY family carbohydrate kinase [Chloroflexota bacterium]
MAEELILAVDAGSSFLKTVVFDRSGRIVARTSAPYVVHRPTPERAEQQPDDWIDLIASSVESLRAGGCDPRNLAGIALSGRGGGAVFLDAAGTVLAPCWLDRRSAGAALELAAVVGENLDYQTRGLAGKTYYLRQSQPAEFRRLERAFFVKDFLLYRLTGEAATDPSSGPPNGRWPRQLWDAVGFPVDRLAPVRPHTAVGGTLTTAVAARLGLPARLPVGVGGHDGACANAGAGAILPGQVCLTLGTNGVSRAIAAAPPERARERRVSPYHFLPGRWCCSGDLVRAGSAPTLVATLLGADASTPAATAGAHARLTREAREVEAGSHGVIYLPFPAGQVSPELRTDARAAFVGMTTATTPAALYRAALEGVACAFRSVIGRQRAIGLTLDDFRLSGGGAQNDLWAQIVADVLGRAITVMEPEEGARGAAIFLAVGLGWFDSPEEAVQEWVRPVARYVPSVQAASYERVYRRFCRLADAVYEADSEGENINGLRSGADQRSGDRSDPG